MLCRACVAQRIRERSQGHFAGTGAHAAHGGGGHCRSANYGAHYVEFYGAESIANLMTDVPRRARIMSLCPDAPFDIPGFRELPARHKVEVLQHFADPAIWANAQASAELCAELPDIQGILPLAANGGPQQLAAAPQAGVAPAPALMMQIRCTGGPAHGVPYGAEHPRWTPVTHVAQAPYALPYPEASQMELERWLANAEAGQEFASRQIHGYLPNGQPLVAGCATGHPAHGAIIRVSLDAATGQISAQQEWPGGANGRREPVVKRLFP
jgi:hypothetical protein